MGVVKKAVNVVCPFIFQRMSRHPVSSPDFSHMCIVIFVNLHVIDIAALFCQCKINYHY